MNAIPLFLFVIFAALTSAAGGLTCQQNARDVGIKFQENENEVTLEVVVPMGFEYLPMLEAPVMPASRHLLEYQREQLSVLKGNFKVTWNRKDCDLKIDKDREKTRGECGGIAVSSVPEVQFQTLSISRITESFLKQDYHIRRFRLMLSREGQYGTDFFTLAIPVFEKYCRDHE